MHLNEFSWSFHQVGFHVAEPVKEGPISWEILICFSQNSTILISVQEIL